MGPEINKVWGRWTSHTEEDCRQKDKHKEWKNEPAGAGTTSRTVGEISSNSFNNATLFNSIIQEQLQDQVDHEDMTWGRCLSTYPGRQEAGEQGLNSKPCHAISPPPLIEVGAEEVHLAESKNGDAIQDDSNLMDPDDEETDPNDLPENIKQRVLRDYMRRQKDRQRKQKKVRQRNEKIQKELEKKKEDLHEMAPGVPTGPGEGVRNAGAFPGLLI